MREIRLEDLTNCQNCGVVFDYKFNATRKYGVYFTVCPLCNHQHELPANHNQSAS